MGGKTRPNISPSQWGWIATGVICACFLIIAISPSCAEGGGEHVSCIPTWQYFWLATPNEVGDTLAGFAGALAFVWIIVTVAMQSIELAAQREELELTRQEFNRMADAQAMQVDLLVSQGKIFEREQQIRDQEFAVNQIEQLQSRARETARQLCVDPFTVHLLVGGGDATVDVKENKSGRSLDKRHAEFAVWVYFDELHDAFERARIAPNSLNYEHSDPALARLIAALRAIEIQLPNAGDVKRGELEKDGYLSMLDYLDAERPAL